MNNDLCINWNINATEIIDSAQNIIKKSIENNNILSKMNISDEKSAQKFIHILSDDMTEIQIFQSVCGFLQNVSPNYEIQKSSLISDLNLVNHTHNLNLNKDIYNKILEVKKFLSNQTDIQYVEKLIENYNRNGIQLNDERKEVILKIRHEISKLENAIINHINNSENRIVEFNIEDLKGIPKHIIKNFDVKNNKVSFNLNKNNFNLIMKFIDNSEIRMKTETIYSTNYLPIIDHLAKIIILRDKHAKILGFDCHSDFKSSNQMTRNSENIKNFLIELLQKINCRYDKEVETIYKIMKKMDGENTTINTWDLPYYLNKWKQEYGVNENMLKEYFELRSTMKKIFNIYEKLFDIKFKKIKHSKHSTWHPNVDLISIENKKKENIGYLYLDLYHRDGKYNQTRCFCLQPPCHFPINKGKPMKPTIALVSSFYFNCDKTILLTFHEVISIFHELAHVIHHVTGKTKYILFSGINVEKDFIETPAQILDLFCWEKDTIKELSCHYQTKDKLNDDIIDKIIKLKNLEIGLYYKRHIITSLFDQIIYSSDNFIDTCEDFLKKGNMNDLKNFFHSFYAKLFNEIMNDSKIKLNENCTFPIDWIHSLTNYNDAQCYSPIWSRVMSSDVFNEKLKNKSFNKNIGLEMIDKIFKYGGSKPSYEMICDYLGRKPAIDGFISMHNLETDVEYSFFLKTEQISGKKNEQSNQTDNLTNPFEYQKQTIDQITNKQTENEETYSASNKFSEINESSIPF